jgi:hypothetical protein
MVVAVESALVGGGVGGARGGVVFVQEVVLDDGV